jgi:hypothetical protein
MIHSRHLERRKIRYLNSEILGIVIPHKWVRMEIGQVYRRSGRIRCHIVRVHHSPYHTRLGNNVIPLHALIRFLYPIHHRKHIWPIGVRPSI